MTTVTGDSGVLVGTPYIQLYTVRYDRRAWPTGWVLYLQ